MNEEESDKMILDLSKNQLKKVPKKEDAQNVRILILDENELQKIDNIDSYLKIETLSLSKNQLLRMYGVCRLHNLRELNLSFNGILSIEGLKDCVYLRHLNLEGNNIKTIEHLNNNTKLEYLNLSENSIGSISDISFLKCLKELYLHGNRFTHLRQCDKYLPISLEVLTLARNNISDLNEICTLSNLCNLHSITITENPCVLMTAGPDGFDHRPFVLNWCMSVKVIDGFVVDPIESLKAEWLYSQGRGRQFRLGEQAALAKYLSSVCPLIGKALENENDRKLRLILSKAQQHQRQLQEEISENSNTSCNNSPSSGRKKPASRIQSPRFSRMSGRQGSPESMISSYHGNTSSGEAANHSAHMTTSLIENFKNDSLMTQSLDASLCSGNMNTSMSNKANSSHESTPRNITPSPYSNEQTFINPPMGGPLAAASKMVPVPESLMSPDVCPSSMAHRVGNASLISTNSKMHKNKDNKLNSPKVRSPHLKRNAERSPLMSPRKMNVAHATPQSRACSQSNYQSIKNQMENHEKSRLNSNSMHVSLPADDSGALSSDEDSDHINEDKLKTIRNKAAQRCQQQKGESNQNVDSSALVIQKIWRGYRTRKKTKDIAEKLLKKRTSEYIEQLTKDMELTKAQLENERKIQQLQMQAINALWKRISAMPGGQLTSAAGSANVDAGSCSLDGMKTLNLDNNSTAAVHDLAKTCTVLTNQVQQLQGSMSDILNCLAFFCNLPQQNIKKMMTDALTNEKCDSAATQTEIVAVHTPQVESLGNFPFTKIRPSTLPLDAVQQAKCNAATESVARQPKIVEQHEENLNESGIASDEIKSNETEGGNEEKRDADGEKEIAAASD